MKDTLFLDPGRRGAFAFDEAVADVFDDMLKRSVPFYFEVQNMIADLSAAFIRDGGLIYDLGCSTGTTMALLAQRLSDKNPALIGLDNSPPMLERADKNLQKLGVDNYELREADLNRPGDFQTADVIVMNLVLQFIRPDNRAELIGRLYEALAEGGCLILVEKVRCSEPGFDELFVDAYHEFKKRNLYSDEEIARKREALENTLIAKTAEENKHLLIDSGFKKVETFFRWFNFCGFVAEKG